MILSEIESPKGPMRLQACDQLHSNNCIEANALSLWVPASKDFSLWHWLHFQKRNKDQVVIVPCVAANWNIKRQRIPRTDTWLTPLNFFILPMPTGLRVRISKQQ